MENIELKYKNKYVNFSANKVGFLRKGLGLMFRAKNTDNLLFEFSKDVKRSLTSWFVFFPFLVIWLDKNNRVIGKRIVMPFEFKIGIKSRFRKVVEIPINVKNKRILDFFRR